MQHDSLLLDVRINKIPVKIPYIQQLKEMALNRVNVRKYITLGTNCIVLLLVHREYAQRL